MTVCFLIHNPIRCHGSMGIPSQYFHSRLQEHKDCNSYVVSPMNGSPNGSIELNLVS